MLTFQEHDVVKANHRRQLYLHFLVHTRLNTWLKNVGQRKQSKFQ